MLSIKEAQIVVAALVPADARDSFMKHVRTLMLAVHVAACVWHETVPLVAGRACGDGWLCEQAKELEALKP